MAEKKEKEKQLTVEERLKSLYELQTILTEIDRIKTIRGELPLEVKDLEDNIEGLRTRIVNYNNEIAELKQKLAAEKEKIVDSQNKIARYKEQLDNVNRRNVIDPVRNDALRSHFQTFRFRDDAGWISLVASLFWSFF